MHRVIALEVDSLFARCEATVTNLGFNGSELNLELLGCTTSTRGPLWLEISWNPYLLRRVSRQQVRPLFVRTPNIHGSRSGTTRTTT